MFVQEFSWTVLVIISLLYAGGFAVLPFATNLRYPLFLAPFAGLTLVVISVSVLYCLVGLSVFGSVVSVFVGYFILTTLCIIYELYYTDKRHLSNMLPDVSSLLFVLSVIAIWTYFCNYTSIEFNTPSLLFMNGTDQQGYVQVADWLNSHFAGTFPVSSSTHPYESWSSRMFQGDMRFSSYFTLAILAILKGYSAMFTYDSATAVVLSVMCLGICSVFTRSRLHYWLFFLALITCYWPDYGRQGFFAKFLAYPGSIIILGLFMKLPRPLVISQIAILLLMTIAISTMHSFLSVGLFFITLGSVFILVRFVYEYHVKFSAWQVLKDDVLLLSLMMAVIIATTGIFAKTFAPVSYAAMSAPWSKLLPRILDIESLYGLDRFTLMSPPVLMSLFVLNFFAWAYFLMCAYRAKRVVATAFLISAALIIFLFVVTIGQWQLSQLQGFIYPLLLCAIISLLDQNPFPTSTRRSTFIAFFALVIVSHLPRVVGDFRHYAGDKIMSQFQYRKIDLDSMAAIVKNQSVTVDVPDPFYSLPIITEFGRRQIPLQFSEIAWKATFGYTDWSAPRLSYSPYWITLKTMPVRSGCKVVYTSIQFQLLKCEA